jgi:hypothetical protein
MNVRALAVAGAVVGLAGVVPAGASATTTVKCTAGKYLLVDNKTSFPVVHRLRATGLPAKTDGYAPRCLVAEAVAAVVQQHDGRKGRWHVYGARWDGGWWTISYKVIQTREGAYAKYTARNGAKTVTFDGGS